MDRETNVLGVFTMTGAPAIFQIRGGGPLQTPDPITGLVPVGLEGTRLPSRFAALSKAGTSAGFSTGGNAFTTRTASFIIQEHFPPGVDFQPRRSSLRRPVFIVAMFRHQNARRPTRTEWRCWSMPIYKNGVAQGGVGIEGDGLYGVDCDPRDFDLPFEEVIAVSAVRGFEPPPTIRGDNILVNGIRLPFRQRY